jgi:nickel transport system ATP-binding protein
LDLLELKGIYKSYRRGALFGNKERFEVLKEINLNLKQGDCLGLLGRSGSGKSTLGRIVLNLEPPDSGKVFYQGRWVQEMTKQEYRDYRKNTQVVFQNSLGSTNPRLTAGQIVAEPITNFETLGVRQLQQKINELLERVGLSSADTKKYPHQFSGGELQRVCIARAIALQPKLIVLDEAVSSLDMLIQARILELLRELQKELAITYLFISHDIRVLLKVSNRIAVMDNGCLVEESASMEDLNGFSHPIFSRLIGAVLPPTPAEIL